MNKKSLKSVRNLLAFAGDGLQTLDSSFVSNDYTGKNWNRMNEIEHADSKIMRQLNPQSQYEMQPNMYQQMPIYQQSTMYQQPTIYQQPYIEQPNNYQMMIRNTDISREDRINRFLGKNVQVNKTEDNQMSLDKVIQKAIAPMEERLEDVSVLLGLVVQRLEQLINIVDDNPQQDENQEEYIANTAPQNNFQEEEYTEMETYDPGVSMSLTEDEDEVKEQVVATKKRKKK